MGLLKAGIGALGGVLADSWRDYFYAESMDADILVVKGEKRTGGRFSFLLQRTWHHTERRTPAICP